MDLQSGQFIREISHLNQLSDYMSTQRKSLLPFESYSNTIDVSDDEPLWRNRAQLLSLLLNLKV